MLFGRPALGDVARKHDESRLAPRLGLLAGNGQFKPEDTERKLHFHLFARRETLVLRLLQGRRDSVAGVRGKNIGNPSADQVLRRETRQPGAGGMASMAVSL